MYVSLNDTFPDGTDNQHTEAPVTIATRPAIGQYPAVDPKCYSLSADEGIYTNTYDQRQVLKNTMLTMEDLSEGIDRLLSMPSNHGHEYCFVPSFA